MKTFILPTKALAALAVLAAVAAPMSASAHRGWLMPSHTVLSGDSFWVSFDAGASNGVFIADHAPLRLSPQSLSITAPDGSAGAAANLMQGAYRTTFDVEVNKPGTWKIANASAGMTATWTLNGEQSRWRGPAAEMAANIPAGATDVASAFSANRLETFVTLGEPTTTVFTPSGVGIEMVPVTHPNDLVAGEAGVFQFLKDGRPYADADVVVARGGVATFAITDQVVIVEQRREEFDRGLGVGLVIGGGPRHQATLEHLGPFGPVIDAVIVFVGLACAGAQLDRADDGTVLGARLGVPGRLEVLVEDHPRMGPGRFGRGGARESAKPQQHGGKAELHARNRSTSHRTRLTFGSLAWCRVVLASRS